jgi:hypothetical protein
MHCQTPVVELEDHHSHLIYAQPNKLKKLCLHIVYVPLWYTRRNVIKKLHGLSLRANYTDRATAACRQSDYQLLRIEGVTWSV